MPSKTLDEPIFLIGAERSGSTLLRLILDHHPDLALNLESDFLVTQISASGEFPDMAAYRAWLLQDRVFRHSHFLVDENLDYAALVNDFLHQKRGGKRFVGATVHHEFGKLRHIWPNAKYVYLYRDGRDVSSSIVKMGWSGNTYVAADRWLKAERDWDELRGHLPEDRWIEVSYFTLINDVEIELKRVCDFIGIEFSNAMFDYALSTTYSRPDKQYCDQWKTRADTTSLRLLEGKIGERLRKRGHELSGLPPIRVGRFGDLLLRLHSRFGTMRHSIETFGLGLTMQERLARRLGMKSMHAEATRRIDQIIDRNLR